MIRLKVGIIGCGNVSLEGHIPAFRQLKLDIAGVADANKAALKKVGSLAKYLDYRELLKNELDIVSICTPPFLHHQMCIDAAEHGTNILVEKPLALTVEEGEEIKKAVIKNDVKLCVVHNYKFIEPIMKVKSMQDKGQLGNLSSMHSIIHSTSPPAWGDWRMNEAKSGSMIMQWNHPLYLHTWFSGVPKSVYAVGQKILPNYPQIRNIKAIIRFSGSVGYLEMNDFCASPQIVFNFTGTGATVNVKLPIKTRIVASSTPVDTLEEAIDSISNIGKLFNSFLMTRKKPYLRFTSGSHFRLIEKYVEAIKCDLEVPASVDEGIMSIRLAKAIDDSVASQKEIIF